MKAPKGPDRIVVIRHAQKPTDHPRHQGVLEDGTHDPESLTVRGWQHAGSLAAVFARPPERLAGIGLARPTGIFAAGLGKKKERVGGKPEVVGSHSRRPLQTVTPMAERLELKPVTRHRKGEEGALVEDILSRSGTVLVCWQHEEIPAIGNLLIGNDTTVPQTWPEDGYDLVWLFERDGKGWRFSQMTLFDGT